MQAAALAQQHDYARTGLDARVANVLRLVQIADRFGAEAVPDPVESQIRLQFAELVRAFDAAARTMRCDEVPAVAARIQAALLPLMRRAENGFRWYAKPRGYAGDFATIARIYDDEARGATQVDRLLDRCFLDFPAVFAVQNRRALVAAEIRSTIRACAPRGSARVTSLACGPARELFDVYAGLDDPRALDATLIDFDPEALAYCRAERTAHDLEHAMNLVEANLIHVAVGRRELALPPQDLVYSIGLIDYFDDNLVVKLLDWIHSILRPGGRVVLGNFHPRNPTRAAMDHVLEWRLIHRDEADMHRLLRASAFGTQCSRITYEPQRINLFAECVKTAGEPDE